MALYLDRETYTHKVRRALTTASGKPKPGVDNEEVDFWMWAISEHFEKDKYLEQPISEARIYLQAVQNVTRRMAKYYG